MSLSDFGIRVISASFYPSVGTVPSFHFWRRASLWVVLMLFGKLSTSKTIKPGFSFGKGF